MFPNLSFQWRNPTNYFSYPKELPPMKTFTSQKKLIERNLSVANGEEAL
jgi:hypothetical protein